MGQGNRVLQMPLGEYLTVVLLTLGPALGNFGGGLLAEAYRVSQHTLSLALHLAAGIVLAVIGIELMPEALKIDPQWVILLAFVAGGGFSILMDSATGRIQNFVGDASSSEGPWGIYLGVAVDLFSDGVLIGTGSTVNPTLGLLLALGQIPADIPEGFATIATFRKRGISRRLRLLLSASFVIPIFLGATIGYWAVRGEAAIYKFGLLAFTAGILLTVVVEEIVPEAHEDGEAQLAAIALVGGFALFALITVYLG